MNAERAERCRQCNGTGDLGNSRIFRGSNECWECAGTGLKVQPKYRATCETCGKRQPRATTAFTAHQWMQDHNITHRPKVEP